MVYTRSTLTDVLQIWARGLSFFCLIMILCLFFPLASSANNIHCVCLTGDSSTVETPIFNVGCRLWLKEQRDCQQKEIHSISNFTTDRTPIPETVRGGTIKIGYVGHWNDSFQSAIMLHLKIRPFMVAYNANIIFDNTACKGNQDPGIVLDVLKEFHKTGAGYPPGKSLTYKANQVTSIGMWDFTKSHNLWATIEYPSVKVTYPACQDFLNHECSLAFQQDQEGFCFGESEELLAIKCQPLENIEWGFNETNPYPQNRGTWQRPRYIDSIKKARDPH